MMQVPDEPLSYACIFGEGTKNHALRKTLLSYNADDKTLHLHVNNNVIPSNSQSLLQKYTTLGHEEKRSQFLDHKEKKKEVQDFFRVLFSIVENIRGDDMLIFYVLALINGILEDDRSRVSIITNMLNLGKNPCNSIGILQKFLTEQTGASQYNEQKCELAVHTLALIMSSYEPKAGSEHA